MDVESRWVEGIGRYSGQIYTVDNRAGATVMFAYGVTVGHGSFSRRVGRSDGKLVVPAKQVGDVRLPELVLEVGMRGYWQVDDRRDVLFVPTLPDGATLIGPPPPAEEPGMVVLYQSHQVPAEGVVEAARQEEPDDPRSDKDIVDDLNAHVAGWIRCDASEVRTEGDLGGGKSVLAFWTQEGDGPPQYSAPDLEAPEGSFERELAKLLAARPKLRDRLRAAANRGHGFTTALVSLIDGAVRDRIYLSPAADEWLWDEDGVIQKLCGFRKGDNEIDLRVMIANGRAVPIAHNTFEGQPVALLGFLIRGGVAYSGREGDPFKLVVPANPGESRTVHILVRHQVGAAVYGVTVSNRSAGAAMNAAANEGYTNPLDAPYRRVVGYAGSPKPTYLVLPDNRVLFVPSA